MIETAFKCTVVTPLFMGGNDHVPEIRSASLKGVLRWWFRAIYGAVLYSKFNDNHTLVLEELHKKDLEWFGSTGNKSKVLINVDVDGNPNTIKFKDNPNDNKFSQYSGYGLHKPVKEGIDKGVTFTLNITFTDENKDLQKYVLAALSLFSLFGNAGSKSTRGFGGIEIAPINDEPYFYSLKKSSNGINDSLKEVLNKFYDDFEITELDFLPKFGVVSPNHFSVKVYDMQKSKDLLAIMRNFGKNLRNFRENKGDKGSKGNFHCYDFPALRNLSSSKAPDNIFGLPHNSSYSDKTKSEVLIKGKDKKDIERRTSPIRFKVIEIDNYSYPMLVLFKSQFIPDGYELSVKVTDKKDHKHLLETPDYSRAVEFMNTYGKVE